MRTAMEAPEKAPDPMFPGSGLGMVGGDPAPEPSDTETTAPLKPGRIRRVLRSRSFVVGVALVVVVAVVVGAAVAVSDARSETERLEQQLAATQATVAETQEFVLAAKARNDFLHERVVRLLGRVATLESAKTETIVETETVTITETVTEYVPNGEGVTIEITGFEELVDVYDVQLTHSYGYSDLIGIAENTSGEVLSYAQLSCSFLDEDGKLLATSIDNKQNWQPGQSWGFVCSADVDATGGILRVDEMS